MCREWRRILHRATVRNPTSAGSILLVDAVGPTVVLLITHEDAFQWHSMEGMPYPLFSGFAHFFAAMEMLRVGMKCVTHNHAVIKKI
jgi:hypothetical protein